MAPGHGMSLATAVRRDESATSAEAKIFFEQGGRS